MLFRSASRSRTPMMRADDAHYCRVHSHAPIRRRPRTCRRGSCAFFICTDVDRGRRPLIATFSPIWATVALFDCLSFQLAPPQCSAPQQLCCCSEFRDAEAKAVVALCFENVGSAASE